MSSGVNRLLSNNGAVRSQAAFSLVEVMCAILVLGIGVAGLTQGISTALGSSKESEVQSTAALLAAGRMELLRADGYLTDGTREGSGDEGFSLYRWRETVSATSIDGLHEVEVAIENSKSGKLIYELKTMLFDPTSISVLDQPAPKKESPESSKKKKKTHGRDR